MQWWALHWQSTHLQRWFLQSHSMCPSFRSFGMNWPKSGCVWLACRRLLKAQKSASLISVALFGEKLGPGSPGSLKNWNLQRVTRNRSFSAAMILQYTAILSSAIIFKQFNTAFQKWWLCLPLIHHHQWILPEIDPTYHLCIVYCNLMSSTSITTPTIISGNISLWYECIPLHSIAFHHCSITISQNYQFRENFQEISIRSSQIFTRNSRWISGISIEALRAVICTPKMAVPKACTSKVATCRIAGHELNSNWTGLATLWWKITMFNGKIHYKCGNLT